MIIDALELDRPGTTGAVWVRLVAGDVSGWGEAAVAGMPRDDREWTGGVVAFLRQCVAPRLVGREVDSAEDLQQRLGEFCGQSYAKGAVDCAWWDLQARLAGVPLVQLLDAPRRELTRGVTLDVRPTIDELLADVAAAQSAGALHVTLKFRPGWALEMLRVVREHFPTLPLRIDGDGLATTQQQDLFLRCDDFQLDAIEQPFPADDLVAHAMLQDALRTAVALDQSITSLARAKLALDAGACRAMNLVPDRVGGLTVARQIVAACQDEGVRCYVAASPRTPIGAAHAAALAACAAVADGCELPLINTTPPSQAPWLTVPPGQPIALPNTPGIGVDVDVHQLTTLWQRPSE